MNDPATGMQNKANGKAARSGLLRFLDSGHDFSDTEQTLCYKHRYVNSVVFSAGTILTLFGAWRLLLGNNLLVATLDLIFGALLLGMIVVLRGNPKSIVEPIGAAVLVLSFVIFSAVYVVIPDSVRSGPFLLITASAFFLKGIRHGIGWMFLCMGMMLAVEIIPSPYAKGWYGTLTSMLDIMCLTILLALYEHQKNGDANRLRGNEEKFRAIFESSNDAILLLEGGKFSQWNNRGPELFHCTPDCFTGRRLVDLLSDNAPAEHHEALNAAETAVLSGVTQPVEVLLRRHSGADFYANIRLTQMSIGGQPFIQAIIRDIDARKRSELELALYRQELEQRVQERTRRLEESELRFARLLELTEEGIFIHENGVLVDVTNAFCRITGYLKAEAIGKNFLDLLVDPDQHQFIIDYMTARKGYKYELKIRHQDGRYLEVEAFGRSFEFEGRLLRAGVWRDITARKETERVLRAAQETAAEANRAKSAFIANMSHEIRTPLNAIIGITHRLQAESRDESQRIRLERATQAAKHLLTILTDILDISKMEAGKLLISNAPFSPEKLVARVGDLVRDSAESKGLALQILTDERIPRVLVGDAVRLSQVLVNLLSNSVKFTESGSVTLAILLLVSNNASCSLRFRVSDTGIGMTPEQQARLFHDFEQAEASITRKYGGTGLGLSISRRLVELMKGSIQIRSEIGRGSEFWFEITLPISEEPADEIGTSVVDVTPSQIRAHHAGARILLVEDTPINRDVAQDYLGDAGLRADLAENGKQAIDYLRDNRVDLVLMDLQMPIMDGLTATRFIRTLPGCERLPIIAMTANAYPEDRQQCLAAGMNDYLAKPIEPEAFYAMLAKWLPAGAASPEVDTVREEQAAQDTQPTIKETAKDQIEKLGSMPGFEGLQRVSLARHKPARCIELLLQLFTEHGQDGQRLQEWVSSGTEQALTDAKRLTHTLKGISSTFGMVKLQELSEALNTELERGIPCATQAAIAVLIDDTLRQLSATARKILQPEDRLQ
jgi:PAS domain S-box-containing protein